VISRQPLEALAAAWKSDAEVKHKAGQVSPARLPEVPLRA
jgi:hypothetical protein